MIRRQVVVPAPPADVWEFVTEPETAGPWLGGRLSWSTDEGSELSFESDDGEVRKGVVEVVCSGRYLQYRWWPETTGTAAPATDLTPTTRSGPATQVAFILEPDAGDTQLTVVEQPVPEPDPDVASRGPSASIASTALTSGARSVRAAWSVPLAPLPDLVAPAHVADLLPLAALRSVTSWTGTDDMQLRVWAERHLAATAR